MKTRRKFTREFKISILNELVHKSVAEVCKEHNILPTLIYHWRNDHDSNPKQAFNGNGKLWKEDAKIAQYERLVGQLYSENTLLKKVLQQLQERIAEERLRS